MPILHVTSSGNGPTLLIAGERDRYIYQETLKSLLVPSNIIIKRLDTGRHTLVRNIDVAERLVQSHLLQ